VFFSAIADAVGDRVPVFDVVHGQASLPSGRGTRDDAAPSSSEV